MTQNCLPLGSLVVTFSPPKALPLESRTRLCPCWQAPQASCSSSITLGPPPFPSELSQLTQRGSAAMSHPSCQARQRSRPLLSLLGLLGRGCVQGGLGFRLCTQEQRQRVLCAELPALGDLPGRAVGTVPRVCRRESSRRQEPLAYMFSPQALGMVGPQACGQRPVWTRGSPERSPHLHPQPQLLLAPVPPLRSSWAPEKLTSNEERLVEAARDRPRDIFTASGGAGRADTEGHTHGTPFPGWGGGESRLEAEEGTAWGRRGGGSVTHYSARWADRGRWLPRSRTAVPFC